MHKYLKWSLIIGVAVVVALFVGRRLMGSGLPKASPEEIITFTVSDLTATVDYGRPSKKGRVIFGGLVPYGKVWRTGANEATTFTVDKPITFGGKPVQAGTYTLWTIPGPAEWSVILNAKMYGWGINSDGTVPREPLADVAVAKVRPIPLVEPVEQFTILVEGPSPELVLQWDLTRVEVPLDQ